MTPRITGTWLPSILLLLQVPGCFPLSGPSTMTGTEGQSLSVQCQYEKQYRRYNKYWCRYYQFTLPCSKIVETKGQEEVKKGRVSIRDHPAILTFTVTLENLTLEDAGTYWCGMNIPWNRFEYYPLFQIMVSVLPDTTTLSSPEDITSTPGTSMMPSVHTQPGTTRGNTTHPSSKLRSPLNRIHFLLQVFLELPLLLGMLFAVLWVNRPQRCLGRERVNQL